jgi:hypothetical protein
MTRWSVHPPRCLVKRSHAPRVIWAAEPPAAAAQHLGQSQKSEAITGNSLVIRIYIQVYPASCQAGTAGGATALACRGMELPIQGCQVGAIARRSEPPQSHHALSHFDMMEPLGQEFLMDAQRATPTLESSGRRQKTFTRRRNHTLRSHLSCMSDRGILPLTNGAANASGR